MSTSTRPGPAGAVSNRLPGFAGYGRRAAVGLRVPRPGSGTASKSRRGFGKAVSVHRTPAAVHAGPRPAAGDPTVVTGADPAGSGPAAPAGSPPADHSDLAPATRSRSGQLLREVAHWLTEASRILSDDPSPEAIGTAVARLEQAREAMALLAHDRASPQRSAAPSALADAPVRLRRTQLGRSATSPQTARAFVKETCAQWSVAEEVTAAAIDVSSELVTNAVQRADVVLVAVELRADALVLSVWDDGEGRPHVLPYRPGRSERGIGLRLVKQLSESWGWTDEQQGKWVWARLALPDADDQRGPVRRSSHPGRRPRPQ